MIFSKTVNNWYSINKRELPWRGSKNPYKIWLSEIILQQTQVKQGLPYYEAFVTKFPTVFDLANAEEETVLKLWQGLGYYSRARNLHTTAKYIVDELNGVFPETYDQLLKLKGVGDYTASAIASICFNEAFAVVDGNVYRVLSRYFGIKTAINSTLGKKEFKLLAQKLLPKGSFGDYNQAVMEFGAKQCKPSSPDCSVCPLNSSCAALEKDLIKTLPVKEKKTKLSHKFFNFVVYISEDKKTILEQRVEKGIWHKLYQFPLVESAKSIKHNAFKNLLKDLTHLKSANYSFHLYNEKDIIHKLSHQHLHCKFWIVLIDELPKKAISIKDIDRFAVPAVIEKFLNAFNFETISINSQNE